MSVKKLLEEAALYQMVPIHESSDLSGFFFKELPAITARCLECQGGYTFNAIAFNRVLLGESYDNLNSAIGASRGIYHIIYKCRNCNSFLKDFLVRTDKRSKTGEKYPLGGDIIIYAEKIGQYPAYEIKPEPAMSSYLDADNLELYKRGIVSESQGYGVGAFAYYRQVVENKVDDLITGIEELVKSNEEETRLAFENARNPESVAEKIKAIYDHMPATLSPGGKNVLKIVYGKLSTGLHSMSDPECLESAQAIRGCLLFLIKKMEEQKRDDQAFLNSIKELERDNNIKSPN